MYLTETTRTGPNGTTYRCVLLRQSYREGGEVKNRTIANLSHCPPEEVAAIRLALQHKDDLTVLGTVKDVTEIAEGRDRKSTRLNSSHSQISYAVFCLKKKNK